jgi:hypothetical protein
MQDLESFINDTSLDAVHMVWFCTHSVYRPRFAFPQFDLILTELDRLTDIHGWSQVDRYIATRALERYRIGDLMSRDLVRIQ